MNLKPPPALSRDQEISQFRDMFKDDRANIMAAVERQFGLLHNRAQVLLGLCGIVVSTTGFSGRLIAGTNTLAQVLVIVGLALVLLAAIIVSWGVLHLRWLTLHPGESVEAWLRNVLHYRDLKTLYYRVGIVFMNAGLVIYAGAIAVMLTYPHEHALPAR